MISKTVSLKYHFCYKQRVFQRDTKTTMSPNLPEVTESTAVKPRDDSGENFRMAMESLDLPERALLVVDFSLLSPPAQLSWLS